MSEMLDLLRAIDRKLDIVLEHIDRQPPAGATTSPDGVRHAQGSGAIREHTPLPPFQRDPARLASIAERRAAKQALADDSRRPTEGDPAS